MTLPYHLRPPFQRPSINPISLSHMCMTKYILSLFHSHQTMTRNIHTRFAKDINVLIPYTFQLSIVPTYRIPCTAIKLLLPCPVLYALD
eukprot:jgi/Botrbrau1/22567/Bobra.176_1s0003.1